MDAITNTESQWFRDAAERLVTERGVKHAQKVADYHRSDPLPCAFFYSDMTEAVIAAQTAQVAA